MNVTVEVTASMLNVRSGSSTSFNIVGVVNKGEQYTSSQQENDWYYLDDVGGWSSGSYLNVVANNDSSDEPTQVTQSDDSSGDDTPQDPTDSTGEDILAQQIEGTISSSGLDQKTIQNLYSVAQSSDRKANLSPSTRLFGSPHQFLSQTDFRVAHDDFSLGRKYLESIVSEAPIVYFLPGRANYLPGTDASQKDAITQLLLGKESSSSEGSDVVNKITNNKDLRYFNMLTDYSSYMRYVNLLCRFTAIYMGVGDVVEAKSGVPYKHYDWSNYRYDINFPAKDQEKKSVFDTSEMTTSMYDALFGDYQYVQFYVEPNTSFSESSGNSTTQSKIAGLFEGAEGAIKEVAFLTNALAINGVKEAQNTFSESMNSIAEHLKGNGNGNFFSRLLGMSSNVISGSNVIFPEIWGDASYNKSYNISINLVSPYGDKESIYLNIIVPIMHIMALALPRQTTANSYSTPFLVKAFAKGWFSCEMGMIDSLVIDKGGDGSWTVDGLPSEVRLNIGIKDLYSNLMITPNSSPDLFFQNQGLIDFLAVTCGVDITKPQFATQLQALLNTLFTSVTDIPKNVYRDFIQGIRNQLQGFYKLQ